MLGGVHLRMENFQESWLMSQQAGVSGLCEKFHLYRLEKLVAISIFWTVTAPESWVGGRISRDRLPPGGATCPWLACPPGATCPGGKINWDTGIK